MNFDYRIEVLCDPTAKGRPRATRTGRMYTPKKTRDAEAEIRMAIGESLSDRDAPLFVHGPLFVEMEFIFRRPVSQKRNAHVIRPDLDNLIKLVGDAGNGVLWRDDSIIECVRAKKAYGERGSIRLRVFDMAESSRFLGW